MKRWGWVAAILYAVLLLGTLAALPLARNQAIGYLGTTRERAAWEQWRVETRRQESAGGSVKLAIVMHALAVSADEAQRRIDAEHGVVRRVIGGDPPPVA